MNVTLNLTSEQFESVCKSLQVTRETANTAFERKDDLYFRIHAARQALGLSTNPEWFFSDYDPKLDGVFVPYHCASTTLPAESL